MYPLLCSCFFHTADVVITGLSHFDKFAFKPGALPEGLCEFKRELVKGGGMFTFRAQY